MSDERTPLQKLDDAVHEFAADTDRQGVVGSWVLAYETSRVQTDDALSLPLVHGSNYSIGPGTSVITALGLGRYIAAIAESALTYSTTPDQEDDE